MLRHGRVARELVARRLGRGHGRAQPAERAFLDMVTEGAAE